ncbi:MAG: SWIM zinc finger family protein, partial [Burkholderiales bacterium]|nr:SWIM zinc finger family protein [Burkholderiales bacterium]
MNWEKLIAKNFDTGAVSRGRDYWKKGRVRFVEWQPSGDGPTLFSKVRGSSGNYDQVTRVDFDGESIDGDCTCPVAYNCKHVAAALFEANETPMQTDTGDVAQTHAAAGELYAFTGDHDPAKTSAIAPRRVAATMPLPYPIELWLTQVAAAQSNAGESYPADVAHRILYVFEPTRQQTDQGGLVRIFKARVKKSGEFTSAGTYHNTNSYFSSPRYMLQTDTRILRQLSSVTGRGYSFEFPMVGLDAALVRTIIETGRAYWLDLQRPALRWAAPRAGLVEWTALENGDRQPTLATQPPATAMASLPPIYIDANSNECGLVDSALTPAIAMAVAAAPALPAKWVERVSRELQTRNLDHSIPLPARMEEETLHDFHPQPVLTLKSHQTSRYDPRNWKESVLHFETAALVFDYLGARVTGKTPLEITRVDGNRLLRVSRNAAFERAARARLTAVGLTAADKILTRNMTRELQGTLTVVDATVEDRAFSAWTTFLETTVPVLRREGWKIDIAADFRFDLTPISEWYADVDESSNQWFDLEIGIEVEGARVSLIPILVRLIQASPTEWRPAALEAMADESKIIVPLGDGRRAALPLARLKPLLATLFELYLREPTAGRVRLSPLDAARLAEMDRALDLRWLGGERMRQLGARLARFDGIATVPVPPDFQATLRPYQQEGLAWLQFLREYELSGVLADDMGLGKTVQTLAHLATEKAAGRLDLPALVVAPTSMMGTWFSEATRFAPGLKVMVSHGVSRHERDETFADFDLVLTTYALLAR